MPEVLQILQKSFVGGESAVSNTNIALGLLRNLIKNPEIYGSKKNKKRTVDSDMDLIKTNQRFVYENFIFGSLLWQKSRRRLKIL